MALVDELRQSRKSPVVLKLKILKIRGEDPDILIFVYEGVEDVPVYEEWMRRIACCPQFESVAGAGKEQLLSYYDALLASKDHLLEKIYFFVDRDFDLARALEDHVFELEAYSVENVLCTIDVLESLLRDEFRRTGRIVERARVRQKFSEISDQFADSFRAINLALFSSRRLGIAVLRKPKKVTDVVTVSLNAISSMPLGPVDPVTLERALTAVEFTGCENEFERLGPNLNQRGKYVLDVFRRWLRTLVEDLKSPVPQLFESSDPQLPGDPSNVSMRRLASAAPIPPKLSAFMLQAIVHKHNSAR